jgi:SAM-dependent methyltransferase
MDRVFDTSESRDYLISMTPVEEIIQMGRILGLNPDSRVLDLCCGYGEMLRIFAGYFGCQGTGIDRWAEFIDAGIKRNSDMNVTDRVKLITQDAQTWRENNYDVACLIGEHNVFGGFEGTLKHLLGKIKVGGSVIIGTPYYNLKDVPPKLIDYEGELQTESEIFAMVQDNNCIVTGIGRDTRAEWDRYISWSARRGLKDYRNETDEVKRKEILMRLRHWHGMYIEYRMKFQGWAMYAIERVDDGPRRDLPA